MRGGAADALGDRGCVRGVTVGDDDARADVGEAAGERRADPARAAGDHGDLAFDVHRPALAASPPSACARMASRSIVRLRILPVGPFGS